MLPDLLVLLCDTARADAFRPWGGLHPTPTLERLCREGVTYDNAVAPAPWTVPSIASMFSGRLPTEHGITGECLTWTEGRPTSPAPCVRAWSGPWLPEDVRRRGYRTWAASCNSWISHWGGFDRGFEELLDVRPWARPRGRIQRLWFRAGKALGRIDRGGRESARLFAHRLGQAGREPLFAFVDLMETHAPLDPPRPWYPFPPWRRVGTRRLTGGPDQGLSYNAGLAQPRPGYASTVRGLYYSSARYEDWILGRFVEAVEARGRPTVVALVSDHGEHLGEHGLFNHNSSLHQALLHVPLVVWTRGVELGNGQIEQPVSLTDVGAWLLRLAESADPGLPAPDRPVQSEYEGTARHNGIPPAVTEHIASTDSHVPGLVLNPGMAVRDGPLKYVAVANGEEHLFDLSSDPGEDLDLALSRPDLMARFGSFREAWEGRRQRAAQSPAIGQVAEGEIAEHLRELGYIE